jgi:transposase
MYKGKTYMNIELDLINKTITLPKLKEVKIKGYRNLTNIDGRIINATVSKEKDNKYYVSVVFEEKLDNKEIIPTKIIGLDLGIKDLVITSDGKKYNNEKVIEKYEKRIKRKQRQLSKKTKGSNNYYKTKQQLARLYTKIKNARNYEIHKINLRWASKVHESKLLVSKQFENISSVLNCLRKKFQRGFEFDELLEAKIRANLDKKGIYAENIKVSVTECTEVTLTTTNREKEDISTALVASCIGAVLETPVFCVKKSISDASIFFHFREKANYSLET